MYSVLIQNSKTLEVFEQFRILFTEPLNSNMIGVCKWNESGTTVETALPELNSLTDDKEEWRAIIVRYIDDYCMTACESSPQNPYDFVVNQSSCDEVRENEVPLVRLTQMLGGVPALEVKFKPEIIKEEHKAPRTIYVPIIDKKREAEYQSLVEKYRYNGKLPSSIMIVSLRKRADWQSEEIKKAWMTHKESESSEFWKRNRYPSICRFLVYDYINEGSVKKIADDFNFWFSIMLLSVNEIDSSTLQAYRLYTINTLMDSEKMIETFQNLTDKLRDAKYAIEKSIRRDVKNQICEEEQLPEYRMDIPVTLKLPKTEERVVNIRSFSILSEGANTDLSIWNRKRKEIEKNHAIAVRSAERTLNQTADKLRDICFFDEEEVLPLNKYQEEDLRRETNLLYHKIVEIQGRLPNDDLTKNPDVSEITSQIRGRLGSRVLRPAAIVTYCIAVFMLFLAAVPAIIEMISGTEKSYTAFAFILVLGILVEGIFALMVLLIQKGKLNRLIRKYNQCIKKAFGKLVENAEDYSSYMSFIVSHARGASYIHLSSRKKYLFNEEHYSKYKHIKAINVLLEKIRNWSKAYHLDIDFGSKRSDVYIEIDTTISPEESKWYAFECGMDYLIGINNSGMTLKSPFSFAKKIEIIREEIYDDESN